MTAALITELIPYGAPELRRSARPTLARALVLSSFLGTIAFAMAWSLSAVVARTTFSRLPRTPSVDILPWAEPAPPPPLIQLPRSQAPVRPRSVPIAATPIPVPQSLAPPDSPPAINGGSGHDRGSSEMHDGIRPAGPPVIEPPVNLRGTPPLVDELPVPITRVQPEYPSLPREMGIEGLVMVHVLVGQNGQVLDAEVDSHRNVPLLNSAALDAARQWTFQPALRNDHPVSVWVAIPFRFKLH